MNLTQINSLNFSSTSQLQNEKVSQNSSVQLDFINNSSRTDRVDLSHKAQTPFVSNLLSNMTKLSNFQTTQSNISKQTDILNQIEFSIKKVVSNPIATNNLNDIQPKIANLIAQFNQYSKEISSTSLVDISQEGESRVYFDGILGAKPLSSEEIYDEVNSQRERLEQINKIANQEAINTINDTKTMFNREKQELVAQKPQLKEFDFGSLSSNFESKSLQDLQGSMVDTQANANLEQNIKLLAS